MLASRGSAALSAFLGVTLLCASARAADPDPWFGRDKALHFAVSAAIAGAGYGVTTALARDRWKAFAVGAGAALAAGALKEGYDAAGHGDPSWKDMGWDVIGTAVGLAIAWGIDAAVHGGKPAPLSARLSLEPRAASASWALRF